MNNYVFSQVMREPKGEISPELKEAILYLDHEEITGSYSEELDEAVQKLKSSEEDMWRIIRST